MAGLWLIAQSSAILRLRGLVPNFSLRSLRKDQLSDRIDRLARINALRASCASVEMITRRNARSESKTSLTLPVRAGKRIRKKEATDARFPR